MDIKITKNPNPKEKPDQHNLGFGDYFTDHMFMMDYKKGKGCMTPASYLTDPSPWIIPPWSCITL